MKEFLDISNTRLIQLEIDKPFGFLEKLKLKGIGSPRCIYLKGSAFFDEPKETSSDLEFVNFEIYPGGIVGRYSKGNRKRGIAIKKKDINKIIITTSYILVQGRNGSYKTPQAKLDLSIDGFGEISFFIPPVYYKSTIPFWEKDWLKEKSHFIESTDEPELDKDSKYISLLEALANL